MGKEITDWNSTFLVEFLLREEQKRWQKLNVDVKHKHLVAFSTIVGKRNLNVLLKLPINKLFPTPDDYRPEAIEAVTGVAGNQFVAPLEPDIIGEHFVLSVLTPRHDADTKRLETIISRSWNLSAAKTEEFCRRAAQDFPQHPTLRMLLDQAPISVSFDLWQTLVEQLLEREDLEGAIAIFKEVFGGFKDLPAPTKGEDPDLNVVGKSICSMGLYAVSPVP